MRTGPPGSPRPGPSPRSTRCRRPAPAGDRVFLCASLAQGLTRPITPMGRAAFRLIGTSVATVAGHPPADRYRGPSGFTDAGQRIFVDITPILRHPRARRVAVRVAGVMEARTKAVLQHLEDDPRFGPDETTTGRAWPVLVRIFARTRAPLRLVHALISPASALRRVDRIEREIHDRWRIPASATPAERLDAVEERLGTDTFLVMPTRLPVRRRRAAVDRGRPAPRAGRSGPGALRRGPARPAAQRHHRDGSRALAAGQPDRRRPRGRLGPRPRCRLRPRRRRTRRVRCRR